MIQRKLIEGRYLTLTIPQLRKQATEDGIVTQAARNMTIHESTGVFTKTSVVSAGQGTKAHRNFQWLAWQPGAVTQVPLTRDVLTGPMSGCWVTHYRVGAQQYVGHVGTSTIPAETTAAKAAWNAYLERNDVALIGGFNALRACPSPFPGRRKGKDRGKGELYALVTTAGEFYAVFGYWQEPGKPRTLHIRKVLRIPAATQNDLHNI